MRSAAASPNRIAATADASTTATGGTTVAACADEPGRTGRRRESGGAHVGQHVARRQGPRLSVGGGLEDRHQLALERAVVTGRSCLESLDDLVGSILDRQVDRHLKLLQSGGILAP